MARPKAHQCDDQSTCKKCVENLRRRIKYQQDPAEKAKRVQLARRVRQVYKEEVNARDRKRYADSEHRRISSAAAKRKRWFSAHSENKKKDRARYKSQKERYFEYARTRDLKQKRAAPTWLTVEDRKIMQMLYKEAMRTGNHVDHIVPINGKEVCGLHVLWNLQLLDPGENRLKLNKLTKEGEQLAWT